jgi:hypothetical protein
MKKRIRIQIAYSSFKCSSLKNGNDLIRFQCASRTSTHCCCIRFGNFFAEVTPQNWETRKLFPLKKFDYCWQKFCRCTQSFIKMFIFWNSLFFHLNRFVQWKSILEVYKDRVIFHWYCFELQLQFEWEFAKSVLHSINKHSNWQSSHTITHILQLLNFSTRNTSLNCWNVTRTSLTCQG